MTSPQEIAKSMKKKKIENSKTPLSTDKTVVVKPPDNPEDKIYKLDGGIKNGKTKVKREKARPPEGRSSRKDDPPKQRPIKPREGKVKQGQEKSPPIPPSKKRRSYWEWFLGR